MGLPVYLPVSLDCSKAIKLLGWAKDNPTTAKGKGAGGLLGRVEDKPTPKRQGQGQGQGQGLGLGLGLGRAELQLLERAAHDMRRLVPFCMLLIICGELTPLVVLIFGNAITPATCRVPGQINKHRAQRAERKRAAMIAYRAATMGSISVPSSSSTEEEMDVLADRFANPEWARTSNVRDMLCACSALDLVHSHHPFVHGLLAPVYRRELRRFAAYLVVDDALILSGGGVAGLEADEVRLAVVERGAGDVSAGMAAGWEAERVERRWLERWLRRRRSSSLEKNMLS